MGKHTIFVVLALTGLWLLLMEEVSWQNISIGMFVSMLCIHMLSKFMKFKEVQHVNFYKLASYPLWLVCHIYMDAFYVIKMIFTNSKWGFTTEKLELRHEFLRILLADSITLTPGSVLLELNDDRITLLCIGSKGDDGFPASVSGLRAIERVLIKTQREEEKEEEEID